MNFSEQPPSEQWAALKYRGVKFAEVWFKPEGQPFGLTFRIPREGFHVPGMNHLLTTENLLKAVGISAAEVESWGHGSISHSAMDGSNPELKQPFAPPPPDITHLNVYVNLKAPPEVASPAVASPAVASPEFASPEFASPEVASPDNGGTPEVLTVKWQDVETRWRAVLSVEATIDNLRLTIEGIQNEMVISSKKTLMTETKVNALNSDVALWNKAKTRVHYVLPKVREFIHRATWVMGTPERKKLEELFKEDAQHDFSNAEMIKLLDELENLLKDCQVLCSQGGTVYQECKTIGGGIETAYRNLVNNATARADKQRRAGRPKGKFFKTVRKWSGAD